MQRYSTHGTLFKEGGGWLVAEKRDVYLASDVDARIAELEKALQEILGMATETVNQKTCEVPREVLGRARDVLMARESQ